MNLVVLLVVVFIAGAVIFGAAQYGVNEGPEDRMDTYADAIEDVEDVVEDIERRNGTYDFSSGKSIDLSNRGLTSVPTDVFNDTGATSLDLSGNNLSGALQAEVRHLSKLEVLDLSNNNFTGVPAEVGQLSNLRVLNLSNNPITGLPYEIGNLKNLEVLDLRGTNYAEQDLEIIKGGLSSDVQILTG